MIKTKSEDIRRFFDLLGSIFCVLVLSIIFWQDAFRFYDPNRYFQLLLFIIIGLAIYLSFHYLIWRFIKTRFLFGYANFLFISILSASMAAVIDLIGYLISNQSFLQLFRPLRSSIFVMILFYWITSLPMAFFWLIGILSAWKFSKKSFLR